MVSDDICDESCSAIFDELTMFCGSFTSRGLMRHVMSLPKESLRGRVTDFFKTFKIVDFRRDFCH
jgi:hypothetical protein